MPHSSGQGASSDVTSQRNEEEAVSSDITKGKWPEQSLLRSTFSLTGLADTLSLPSGFAVTASHSCKLGAGGHCETLGKCGAFSAIASNSLLAGAVRQPGGH